MLTLLLLFPSICQSQPVAHPKKTYDIYLSGNRVCHKCITAHVGYNLSNERLIALTNSQGQTAIVRETEILGADTAPIRRKLLRKAIQGTGLAGEIINPQAYPRKGDDPLLEYYLK